jgi:hypothetical protein
MGRVTEIINVLAENRLSDEALYQQVQTVLNAHGGDSPENLARVLITTLDVSNPADVIKQLIPVLRKPISESTEDFERLT